MSQQVVQMTSEQLQQLIEAVRMTAASAADGESATHHGRHPLKGKGSFGSCAHRFAGERDHEIVEEFITSICTYKDVESISDEDALRGLPLLLCSDASTWWQGVRKEAKSWADALALIRDHFSPAKPAYQVYKEIFQHSQSPGVAIDTFVSQKRALLAQLPDGRHDEPTELDLIFGLLNIKYRKHIARHDVKSFRDLLERGRIIEHNLDEVVTNGREERDHNWSSRAPKRCTHCNYRGHTYDQCRKRRQAEDHGAAAADDN